MNSKPRRHLRLERGKSLPYEPVGGGGGSGKIPKRDRKAHADYVEGLFQKIWQKEDEDILAYESADPASIPRRDGVYLNFKGKEKYELIASGLEDAGQDVRLCNLKDIDNVQSATLYVPGYKRSFFSDKLKNYKAKQTGLDAISTIELVEVAKLEELWTGSKSIPENDKLGCEVWLSVYKKDKPVDVADNFFSLCEKLEIRHIRNYLEFPERVVVSIVANANDLNKIILHSPNIAEFRDLGTPASFFIENNRAEQKEWADDLLGRAQFHDSDLSICLLDTGVSNSHPLLDPVLQDKNMHTTFDDKDVQDVSRSGHGTSMAGILTYFNLEEALESSDQIDINHKLESVRIIADNQENEPELYASITSRAISSAELTQPNNKRVIAMAVTSDPVPNGNPSSWSAGIDQLALGNFETEEAESRLIFVSAGNTDLCLIKELGGDYKSVVMNHSVEDPGQSWNAITVGAFTEKTLGEYQQGNDSCIPLVCSGSYSPVTTSSVSWSNKWPIKPDFVMEGGNVAYLESHDCYDAPADLCLLTTRKVDGSGKQFTTINGTSAATAQAANLAIRVMQRYPDIWPQTVRAILVHSSNWTEAMIRQEFNDKPLKKLKKSELRRLLRIVGYGTPDIDKALNSYDNSVNLLIEDEIKPFEKRSASHIALNEMALHKIPWPNEVLRGLGDEPVKMRVTLSYFIDPSPGKIGWKDKYRYPGCRLYFDVNNVNESKEDFLLRINNKEREKGWQRISLKSSESSGRWLFGSNNRDTGSVHSDIWEDTAANLAENRFIAVYPGGGWWKNRQNLNRYDSKVKYSLIVSISTAEVSTDLYTPIQNEIKNVNLIEISEKRF